MDPMIIFAGIWVAILPKMKWTSMEKKISLLHYIIGIYTCIIGILSKIKYIILDDIFYGIAFVALVVLAMLTIVNKLKKDRTALTFLAVFIGIIVVAFAILMYVFAPKEICASIELIVALLIILSISIF